MASLKFYGGSGEISGMPADASASPNGFHISARKLILFQLFLASISFAAITSLDVSGSVDESGASTLAITALFSGLEGREACVILSGPVEEAAVRDRTGLPVSHSIASSGNNTFICATVPYDYLEFDVRSDSFTEKEGSLWGFGLGIGASENISSFSSSLALPGGTVLKSTNGAVEGDGGSLILSWKTSNIESLHLLRMKASYEIDAPPQPDYAMVFAFAAIVLAAIAAAAYLARRREKKQPEAQAVPQAQAAQPPSAQPQLESNAVFRTLDETDKELVREIGRQGGKTTQAHLYLHTHVPKATLSRRLASLENRGIIRKSQKGNRNLITFTDTFGK